MPRINLRRLNRRVNKSIREQKEKDEKAKAAAARLKADEEAKKKAKSEAAIAEAGETARAQGLQLTQQAAGITREKFGLGEQQRSAAAKRRADLFKRQQAALMGAQGTQQRQAQEALQRRLQASGLRGSGTAERLAQVAERQMAGQAGEQISGLKLGQSQQELAAIESEEAAVRQFEQFRQQSQQRAQELATNLEAAGVEAERARQFSADQAERNRAFQENVVLKMQSEQFKQKFEESVRQFEQQMKLERDRFDLDEEVTRFNMGIAEAEANKKGMFDRLSSLDPSQLWGQHPLISGNTGGLGGFKSSSPGIGPGIDQFGVFRGTGTGGGEDNIVSRLSGGLF